MTELEAQAMQNQILSLLLSGWKRNWKRARQDV